MCRVHLGPSVAQSPRIRSLRSQHRCELRNATSRRLELELPSGAVRALWRVKDNVRQGPEPNVRTPPVIQRQPMPVEEALLEGIEFSFPRPRAEGRRRSLPGQRQMAVVAEAMPASHSRRKSLEGAWSVGVRLGCAAHDGQRDRRSLDGQEAATGSWSARWS